MAVAFDAVTTPASVTTTNPYTWTHTPSGTPRAAIVLITTGANSDEISAVTYGGNAMSQMTGSPFSRTTGETATLHAWFLDNVPSGAQTVSCTNTGSNTKQAVSITVTAGAAVDEADTTTGEGVVEDPSVTLSLGGETSFCAIVFMSGQGAPSAVTPLSGWTDRGEVDFGSKAGGIYSYDTIGTADVTAGYTAASDDYAILAVAVYETAAAGGGTKRHWNGATLGAGRF